MIGPLSLSGQTEIALSSFSIVVKDTDIFNEKAPAFMTTTL